MSRGPGAAISTFRQPAGRTAMRYALRCSVPYRIDVRHVGADALDRLVELGAIDVEDRDDGGLAALMPDSVAPERVAAALGAHEVSVSPAPGRDAGSIWILSPRAVRVGRLRIVPAQLDAGPGALKLVDGAAFGTGLHPTTALCLEALEEEVRIAVPDAVLDVGTGSGVLALGALIMGVPRALGVDVDDGALRVAAENARLNALEDRFQLAHGGPDAVTGTWPLVVANILPASLVEMAPALVGRVGRQGRLVLSGIPSGLEADVERAYRRLGMPRLRLASRAGWTALVLQASW
jgi:ribosomal protein L11 methyltransferase